MKRKFLINGVLIETVGDARVARKAYNRRLPENKLKSCSEAWQFKEIRKTGEK